MRLLQVSAVLCFAAVCALQDPDSVTSIFREDSSTESPTAAPPSVYEPPVPFLQLLSSQLDVFPSEKVQFSCTVNGSSDWTFTWFRDKQPLNTNDPDLSFTAQQEVLTISRVSPAHAGTYSCKGHDGSKRDTPDSNQLELTVYPFIPKPTVVQTPGFDRMFPGESVTFECLVDVSSEWDYLWYHNNHEIQVSSSKTYEKASIDLSDGGRYHCKAKRSKEPFYTEESTAATLQVSEPPTPVLELLSPWSDVFQYEIVEFSCGVGNPNWTFTWYRNGKEIHEDSDLFLVEERGRMKAFLNITSQTHNGSYACRAHLESRSVSSGFSISTYITVHGKTPKPLVSKDPILDPMYVGETVTFTCNVNVASDWTYEWYKDKLELMGSNKTLRIHLDATGGGKYSCKATRAPRTATDVSDPVTQHVLEIPVPTLQLQTEWPDVFPTESVKMSCGVQGGPGWTYTWYRDRDVIKADGTTSSDSSGATLSINSASALHRGEYTCMAHLSGRPVSSNASLGLSLEVYEKKPDVIFTQDPEYQTMFVGESVSFSCHVNVSAGWEYHWLKNNHTLSKSSQKTLNISIIDLGSRGSYACRTGRGEAQVFYTDPSQALLLEIKENKTSPLITQQPDVDMVYAGESVSFHCEVEISSGWTYQWYKDENLLSTQASFTIDQAAVLDSGMYECVGVREKTNFQTERSRRILRVLEIPVPSLNLTSQWPDVFPTEKVMFRCGMVNASQWTYRWYLDTKEIEVSKDVSCCPEGTSLSIKSASTLHRGRYSCSGQLKSRSVQSNLSSGPTLHVYDTKPNITLMQNPEHQLMHTGDTVSFSCHVNVSSGWEYRWFKDDARLSESEQTHTIKSAVTADSGSYHCQAARGQTTAFLTDSSRALRLDIKERPSANIILLTGWSEVFSTDNLVLQCEVQEGQDKWNYTWFREGGPISLVSEKYTVTPQEDPEQGLYTCQGKQNGRPSYSKVSSPFRTKNLLLKRRVLLAIAGCIFFGIIAVVFGCIVLRFTRKPVEEDTKPEEDELFLTMAQLKDRADAPCPLVEYITDTDLNPPPKVPAEGAELPCCDTTALVTLEEEQAVTTENGGQAETSSGLMSFKK